MGTPRQTTRRRPRCPTARRAAALRWRPARACSRCRTSASWPPVRALSPARFLFLPRRLVCTERPALPAMATAHVCHADSCGQLADRRPAFYHAVLRHMLVNPATPVLALRLEARAGAPGDHAGFRAYVSHGGRGASKQLAGTKRKSAEAPSGAGGLADASGAGSTGQQATLPRLASHPPLQRSPSLLAPALARRVVSLPAVDAHEVRARRCLLLHACAPGAACNTPLTSNRKRHTQPHCDPPCGLHTACHRSQSACNGADKGSCVLDVCAHTVRAKKPLLAGQVGSTTGLAKFGAGLAHGGSGQLTGSTPTSASDDTILAGSGGGVAMPLGHPAQQQPPLQCSGSIQKQVRSASQTCFFFFVGLLRCSFPLPNGCGQVVHYLAALLIVIVSFTGGQLGRVLSTTPN